MDKAILTVLQITLLSAHIEDNDNNKRQWNLTIRSSEINGYSEVYLSSVQHERKQNLQI